MFCQNDPSHEQFLRKNAVRFWRLLAYLQKRIHINSSTRLELLQLHAKPARQQRVDIAFGFRRVEARDAACVVENCEPESADVCVGAVVGGVFSRPARGFLRLDAEGGAEEFLQRGVRCLSMWVCTILLSDARRHRQAVTYCQTRQVLFAHFHLLFPNDILRKFFEDAVREVEGTRDVART